METDRSEGAKHFTHPFAFRGEGRYKHEVTNGFKAMLNWQDADGNFFQQGRGNFLIRF